MIGLTGLTDRLRTESVIGFTGIRSHIVETGNESIRFSRSTAEAKKRIKAREQARKGTQQKPPNQVI